MELLHLHLHRWRNRQCLKSGNSLALLLRLKTYRLPGFAEEGLMRCTSMKTVLARVWSMCGGGCVLQLSSGRKAVKRRAGRTICMRAAVYVSSRILFKMYRSKDKANLRFRPLSSGYSDVVLVSNIMEHCFPTPYYRRDLHCGIAVDVASRNKDSSSPYSSVLHEKGQEQCYQQHARQKDSPSTIDQSYCKHSPHGHASSKL